MTTELTLELDGEQERQFEYLLSTAEKTNGEEPAEEELAKMLLEEAVFNRYVQAFQ